MNALVDKSSAKMPKRGKMAKMMTVAMTVVMVFAMCCMSFAAGGSNIAGADTVKTVLQSMIDIVGLVFQAVGVVLSVYSVGQLVMAFKNEDADSKSRASTMLVVGVILIAIPSIVTGLDLINMIG